MTRSLTMVLIALAAGGCLPKMRSFPSDYEALHPNMGHVHDDSGREIQAPCTSHAVCLEVRW